MERTEIDGVPVLWADLPGPLSASLIIGCGHRDETFETIGITHLVQRLAMAAIDEPACRLDGFVDQDCTMFTVEGSPGCRWSGSPKRRPNWIPMSGTASYRRLRCCTTAASAAPASD